MGLCHFLSLITVGSMILAPDDFDSIVTMASKGVSLCHQNMIFLFNDMDFWD